MEGRFGRHAKPHLRVGLLEPKQPQNALGLGATPSVDSVVVDWPSGNRTVLLEPAVDEHYVLLENAGMGGFLSPGCTYEIACNYHAQATSDDGSCDMTCACGTGTVWDQGAGQCVPSCTADQTGDGNISTADLIVFLTFFGDACE